MTREFIATLGDWPKRALFKKNKKKNWNEWRNKFANSSDWFNQFQLLPKLTEFPRLPLLSFLLQIPFHLKNPYLSKDDREFYLLDNPIRRDKVFQVPMVASTGWKGALRAAMVQQLAGWWCGLSEASQKERGTRKEFVRKRIQLARLLGNERELGGEDSPVHGYLNKVGETHSAKWYQRYLRRFLSSTGFFAGRLHFFPTFFDKIGLEVLNPHDRKKGISQRGPILMECVPKGARGDLVLLYVPFGRYGQDQERKRAEVAHDLETLAEGIQAMLTVYGFGAKTSSGFGTAENSLAGKGVLSLRASLPGLRPTAGAVSGPKPPVKNSVRYLESSTRLHEDFRRPDGSMKSEVEYRDYVESGGGKYNKSKRQLYEKAKNWWEREGRQQREDIASGPKPEPPCKAAVASFEFKALSELRDTVKNITSQLHDGGAE